MRFAIDTEKEIVSRAVERYCQPEKVLRLEEALAASERRIHNAPLVEKLRFHMALCRADAMLIQEVLMVLPLEKRTFFQARYMEKVPITFLALRLHLSAKQLVGWHKEICAMLRDLLCGFLSERILSPAKLRIAHKHLKAILAAAQGGGDTRDQKYLAALHARAERLEQAMNCITDYFQKQENTAERAVVADWMNDSSITYVELAYAHHVSEASARRYVLRFKEAVQDEGKG